MANFCEKCGMLKITPNSKCACGVGKPIKEVKQIKKISDKKKERLKKEGSEGVLFKNIYEELSKTNSNICQICSKIVKENEVTPACFPHILPKGRYKELRYFKNNIGFVCSIQCHSEFDKTINLIKRKIGLFDFEQIIRNGNKINIKNYVD